MKKKIYGLIQSGNRYYYTMGKQEAYALQITPFPVAWKKTPGKSWKRTHSNFLRLDKLGISQGLSGLELDPIVEFDRTGVSVFRLVPSNGTFEYEPDWNDSIPFAEWEEGSGWKEIVSNIIDEIDPKVLNKLRQFSHFHLNLLEALYEWPGFEGLMDSNPALAACVAGRIRVDGVKGERRSRLDYGRLVQCSEREIAAALGYGDSEDVVTILKKLAPDACKPLELANFPKLLNNPIAWNALLDAESITYPALLFLRCDYMAGHLSGNFINEIAELFPQTLDIASCPWGAMLKGGSGADRFTRIYGWALDVVQFYPDVVIESVEDLERIHIDILVNHF